MKQALQRYADGIDAMGLRERAMFFGAVALVMMALLQVFLLNPMLARRNQLAAQIAQQEDETRAIQARIQTLVRPEKPDQDEINRDKLKSVREQIAQMDRQLEEQHRQFVAPAKMAAVLQNLVVKNGKLQLLSLRNLASGAQPGPLAGATPGAAGGREIYRHMVELKVSGGYFDLLAYIAALERMPQQVFWEGFELKVTQYPLAVLTLTLYTLSPEKSWLTV